MTTRPPRPREPPATGLSHDRRRATPSRAPRERARGRPTLEDPVVGWAATLAITLLALFLRLWQLGTPHAFEFDETYYAKDAWSLLHFGYVRDYVDTTPTSTILAGHTTGLWTGRPVDGRPPRGRQVADRAGREGRSGWTPFGWRVASAVVGLADGPGDDPARPPAHRLDAARAASPACCCASTACSSCCRGWPCSTSSWRSSCCARVHCLVADRDWYRARLAGSSRRVTGDALGPGARAAVRPWLLAAGVCWGLACGTQVGGALPAGGLRPAGRGLVRRRPALVRRPPAAAAVGRRRRAAGVRLPRAASRSSSTSRSWTGWLMHADAYEETSRNTQYTPLLAAADRADHDASPTAVRPRAVVTQSLRSLWHYHQRRLRLPHPLPQRLAPTPTRPSRGAGCCSTARSASTPRPASSPASRAATRPPAATCLRQVLLLGNPGAVVGRRAARWSTPCCCGSARRDWRYGVVVVGPASHLAAVVRATTTGRSSASTRSSTLPFLVLARSRWRSGEMLGPSDAPDPAAHGRRGRRRRRTSCW